MSKLFFNSVFQKHNLSLDLYFSGLMVTRMKIRTSSRIFAKFNNDNQDESCDTNGRIALEMRVKTMGIFNEVFDLQNINKKGPELTWRLCLLVSKQETLAA